jgi:hypothetical protein
MSISQTMHHRNPPLDGGSCTRVPASEAENERNLMDIVQEQGAPVQLPEQARAPLRAQKVVGPARIQLRAVNVRHWLPPAGRPEVNQCRYLILLQARLPEDIHRLPGRSSEWTSAFIPVSMIMFCIESSVH